MAKKRSTATTGGGTKKSSTAKKKSSTSSAKNRLISFFFFRKPRNHQPPPPPPPPPAISSASADHQHHPAKPSAKKKTAGPRLWMRLERSGNSEILEYDKSSILRRASLPSRDLRILGPLFSQSSNILAREKAMVVNLEFIKAIVTADEVLLLDPLCHEVIPFVDQLRQQIPLRSPYRVEGGNEGEEEGERELPFEFQVLEVVCMYLDANAVDLERDAYPVLDELARSVSTKNLERVRSLKSNLTLLLVRVQKVLNVYIPKYETGGQMWPMMHNTTIFSLVLAQIIAIGVFGIKISPVASGFTIHLVICTLIFNELYHSSWIKRSLFVYYKMTYPHLQFCSKMAYNCSWCPHNSLVSTSVHPLPANLCYGRARDYWPPSLSCSQCTELHNLLDHVS